MASWVSGSIGVRQVLSYQDLWNWPLSTCQVPESSWLSEKAVKSPPVIHPPTCPCHDPVILEPLTKSCYAQKICVSIFRLSTAPSSLWPVVRRKMLHQQAPGFVQLLRSIGKLLLAQGGLQRCAWGYMIDLFKPHAPPALLIGRWTSPLPASLRGARV